MMKILSLVYISLLTIYPCVGLGDILNYKDIQIELKESSLNYRSKFLTFNIELNECGRGIFKNYLKRFKSIPHTKIEKIRTVKQPVEYTLDAMKLNTFDGSKIHIELEAIEKKILLFKYRAEKKC